MMEVTDRHFRAMMRFITKRAHLYTEMVHARAVLANAEKYAGFHSSEKPVVLQLGGNDPAMLGQASKVAAGMGYAEINLNCGCPSEKVEAGGFGACLMKDADATARMVQAMMESGAEITVKHRIGVSEDRGTLESTYEDLHHFVRTISAAGVRRFIVHARIAVLDGLSTAENRSVPPLRFDIARRLLSDFPHLIFEVNGGIRSLSEAGAFDDFHGVMLGRAVRDNPLVLAGADELLGAASPGLGAVEIMHAMIPYISEMKESPHLVLRHLVSLANGVPGARAFRRFLGERIHRVERVKIPRLLEEAAAHLARGSQGQASLIR
jgi:tRNA-dihydrouridine synthase A